MKGFVIFTGAIITLIIYATIIHYLFYLIFEELKHKEEE